jgi:hypothetical protein
MKIIRKIFKINFFFLLIFDILTYFILFIFKSLFYFIFLVSNYLFLSFSFFYLMASMKLVVPDLAMVPRF